MEEQSSVEQLTLSRLYAIVKAIDDEQRREIRSEQKEKEIAMPIFGILLGVLTAGVILTVALKALDVAPVYGVRWVWPRPPSCWRSPWAGRSGNAMTWPVR